MKNHHHHQSNVHCKQALQLASKIHYEWFMLTIPANYANKDHHFRIFFQFESHKKRIGLGWLVKKKKNGRFEICVNLQRGY